MSTSEETCFRSAAHLFSSIRKAGTLKLNKNGSNQQSNLNFKHTHQLQYLVEKVTAFLLLAFSHTVLKILFCTAKSQNIDK